MLSPALTIASLKKSTTSCGGTEPGRLPMYTRRACLVSFSICGACIGMPTVAPVWTSSVGTSQPDFFLAGFSGDLSLERSRSRPRSLERLRPRPRSRSRLRLRSRPRSFLLWYVPLS